MLTGVLLLMLTGVFCTAASVQPPQRTEQPSHPLLSAAVTSLSALVLLTGSPALADVSPTVNRHSADSYAHDNAFRAPGTAIASPAICMLCW
jgi:hypothetical protein